MYIALDIGGTKTIVATADDYGKIILRKRRTDRLAERDCVAIASAAMAQRSPKSNVRSRVRLPLLHRC